MGIRRYRAKCGRIAATAVLGFLFAAGYGHSFHDGGIGECEGCHSTREASANPYSLKGSDPSSTCLKCHERKPGARTEEHFVSTATFDMPRGIPPSGRTPGGDFGWLKKDYGGEPGEVHGHSINAADFGYYGSSNTTAPGGTYPSDAMHCTSCHDPHGRYRRNSDGTITSAGPAIKASGSYPDSPDPAPDAPVGVYRMLGGSGYKPKSVEASKSFTKDPPAAVSPRAYNRPEGTSQTRVAYGAGMSEWCANCHVNMHGSKMSHPSGNAVKLGQKISTNYNVYVRTGDLSGRKSNSYLSLVPFEEGTSDYTSLKFHARSDDAYLEGPDEKANVSCLSCHRAHASGWRYFLRFGADTAFITVSDDAGVRYPDISREPDLAKGKSAEEIQGAYYDRPAKTFSSAQRPLCGKCHGKD